VFAIDNIISQFLWCYFYAKFMIESLTLV